MKSRVLIVVLLGFAAGLGGCASVSTVMGSDAPFSEKMKQISAILGEYFGNTTGTRAEAARKYKYAGKQEFLEVEGASLTPETASPGQAVLAAVEYVVLAPDETLKIMVVEARTLIGSSDSLLLSKREVSQEQGSHSSTMKFTLPGDIAKGSYTLVTTISYGSQTKSVRRTLAVL